MWSDLREAAQVRGTKSGTPPFKLQPGHEDQYGGINHQESRPSNSNLSRRANQSITEDASNDSTEEEATSYEQHDDLEQAAFEEDNLSDDQKHWLARVRMLNATRTIDVSSFKDALSFAMNATTKGKEKLMANSCADTSITAISNGFTKISRTDKTVTLVGFNDNLSKKEVPIGLAAAAIDLPRRTIIVQLNEAPLLQDGFNSLLSTAQAREGGVIVDDTAKSHKGQQLIQADDHIILLKLQRALLYTSMREPTTWVLENLPRIMLTAD